MIPGIGCPTTLKIRNSLITNSSTSLLNLPHDQPNNATKLKWDVICLTAHLPAHAKAFAAELSSYTQVICQKIIPVSDLAGEKLGSGGATLDALVEVVEHLSSVAGDPFHNEQRLRGKRILILHTGGLVYNPMSWLPAPQCTHTGRLQTAIETLIDVLNVIGTPPSQDDCELFGKYLSEESVHRVMEAL